MSFLQGQLSGSTKYALLHFMQESRGRTYHYTTKEWHAREELVPRRGTSIEELLVNCDKILATTATTALLTGLLFAH